MMRPRHTTLLAIITSLALSVVALHAHAQDNDSAEDAELVRATKVELDLDGEHVIINKLDGWVVGKTPKGGGSIALFRSSGEGVAQIDVRYTASISSEQKNGHFTTFHTHLKSKGLKKVSSRTLQLKEGPFPEVVETVYELTSKKKPFELVVWHTHRNNAAWFFTFFRPANFGEDDSLQNMLVAIEIS